MPSADSRRPPAGQESLLPDPGEWHDRLTRRAATVFVTGAFLLAGFAILRDPADVGPQEIIVIAAMTVLALAVLRRIGWRRLATVLVVTLTVIAAVFPSRMGLRFSPLLVAMLAVAVAASLLGVRAAVAVIVAVCLALAFTGWGVSRGWFHVRAPVETFTRAWGTATVLFAVVAAALTVIITGGVRSLELSLRAQQAALGRLAQSEERLALALRGTDDAVWDWDLVANALWYSPRWWEMLGYLPDDLPGDAVHWEQRCHPDDRERTREEVARVLAGRDDSLELECRLMDRAGQTVPVLMRGYVTRDAAGRALRLSGTASDLTERKQAEAQRETFERQLQETQKLESLGVLAGGIAHDFNNLLTGVLGNTSLAQHELAPDSALHDYLGAIEQAALRAADLCRQLLAYSGKGRFVVSHQNLADLVEESAQLLRLSISKKATVAFRRNDDLPLVDVDATQIRQVIMNLVMNASEALGETVGTITLATSRTVVERGVASDPGSPTPVAPGVYVQLEVSDTGPGMTAETRARIFDPFFTTKASGRGLGLAAVLGIMRGHHGAVRVRSEAGRGTTFTLLFPAVEGTTAAPAGDRVESGAWRGRGLVLVADDEPAVRQAAAGILEKLGFDVAEAADGVEALELFRVRPAEFVLVLLDLTMPNLDGLQTFTELRRLRDGLPIVLMSGFNRSEAVFRFGGQGLSHFVQKPFGVAALRDTLRDVLG